MASGPADAPPPNGGSNFTGCIWCDDNSTKTKRKVSFAYGSAAASERKIKGHQAFTICISQNYQHGRRETLGRIEERVGNRSGLVGVGRVTVLFFIRLHIALVWKGESP